MQFPFKPFEQMTAEDYANIGFMGGLEVHQQLLTSRKLFCRCPAGVYCSEYDAEILRHMRPTLSELGEYDGTALMEKKTRKNIHYRINRETVCTYEFDDTPPFFMDDDALDIAIEISMLLNLNLVNELHVARKQYLDGSIPTGFQRTAIIGVTGAIPFKDRTIGIRQLSIEEDSCREVSDVGHERVLLTDRLGMPLIETVTEPDARNPEELAEFGWRVAHLCRCTGKVRRGYGAAREDVNVSVRGGTRIEIKGVPQIGRIPRLAYNEARRQWTLLQIRDELNKRGIMADTIKCPSRDVTRIIGKAKFEPIRAALARGHKVRCIVLPGFSGLMNTMTQEHTAFAREFSDRVKVIACLMGLPNIIHSDSATESLAARDWKQLYKKTGAGENDVLVLVWGSEQDTIMACSEIAIRATEATQGVPQDTRQALTDGTTGFERVLPGAERMYPDTDLPPVEVAAERVDRIRATLPEAIWKRETLLNELNIPRDCVMELVLPPNWDLFDRCMRELKIDPIFVATVMVPRMKAFRRGGLDTTVLSDDDLFNVFKALADGTISRLGVLMIIEHLLSSGFRVSIEHMIHDLGFEPVDAKLLDQTIYETLETLDDPKFPTLAKKVRFVTGKVVDQLAGRIEGKRVAERVSEMVKGSSNTAESLTRADA